MTTPEQPKGIQGPIRCSSSIRQPRDSNSPVMWPKPYPRVVKSADRLWSQYRNRSGQFALFRMSTTTAPPGAVILTSDTISRPGELEGEFEGYWRPELAKESAHRLMAIAQERDAFVIFGHCPEQWPTLTKIPAYYG